MQSFCGNIYGSARISAGFTQEHAAALLHVSVRSLADYESGRTIPPDDVVCKMINQYKTLTLAYLHLKTNNEVGRMFLPDIFSSDLAQSVLRLLKDINDLSPVTPDMIAIACDNIVHEHEEIRWIDISNVVKSIAGAAFSLILAQCKQS